MKITTPNSAAFAGLLESLREQANTLEAPGAWPKAQLLACAEHGVLEWFIPREHGGQGWSDADIVRGYLQLSSACLTTTFIITQLTGACRRLCAAENAEPRQRWISALLEGRQFATVGISHLTTSRRYLAQPVLRAEQTSNGFRLDGYSPWVTGAVKADMVVVGATLDDGRQVLVAAPTDLPGVSSGEPAHLLGVDASLTGPMQFDSAEIPAALVLGGPAENVMQQGVGAMSGGLQTSTLAVGLSTAAISFLARESEQRSQLAPAAAALADECDALRADLIATAEDPNACTTEDLRRRANSLALRSSQASLAAAKGAGYIVGHPAGRWCREALFFLVWSCPQPVLSANLCELAGITD